MSQDKFNEAIYEFSVETGRTPTKIYLGEEEWGELQVMAKAMTGFIYNQDSYLDPEFMGLKIFLVKTSNHLTVV